MEAISAVRVIKLGVAAFALAIAGLLIMGAVVPVMGSGTTPLWVLLGAGLSLCLFASVGQPGKDKADKETATDGGSSQQNSSPLFLVIASIMGLAIAAMVPYAIFDSSWLIGVNNSTAIKIFASLIALKIVVTQAKALSR